MCRESRITRLEREPLLGAQLDIANPATDGGLRNANCTGDLLDRAATLAKGASFPTLSRFHN